MMAIKDRALDAYMRPFFAHSVGQAVRMFQDEINNNQGEMHKHPDDYDLYHLGLWDDKTATFAACEAPEQVAIGKQYKTA